MKKVAVTLVIVLALAGVIMTLQNNKAKSEAKAKSVTPRPFAVSVVEVGRQQLSDSLSLVGTISANREVSVASETVGKVQAMSLNVGDFKPAGSTLVKVDDELKRASVSLAEVTYTKAQKDLERYRQVQETNALPDQQIDQAAWTVQSAEAQLTTARRQLRDTRIVAPFSGVVSSRSVEIGSMLQPGMTIATLVDISTMKVRLNVSEKDVFQMRVGEAVEVSTDVYPGVTFTGHIASIGAKADEAHTYPVEIAIPNRGDHPLKSGMFGRVSFNKTSSRQALVIPRAAIVGSVKNPQVYVVNDGIAKLRDVMTGSTVGTDIEILKGLSPGEKIVISGQNNLRDNMNVEVVK
jgi:RND family efflux transporter MFP subunit